MKGITKHHIKKAMREHHMIGNLIGMLAKGAGMAAPYIAKGLGMGAKLVGPAASAARAGMAFNQMRQANKVSAAQERIMKAQAQAAEDENDYVRKQRAGR